jgi:hypothetical protein
VCTCVRELPTCISRLWVLVTRHQIWDALRKLFVGPLIVTLRNISSFSFGERRPRAVITLDLDAETLRFLFVLDLGLGIVEISPSLTSPSSAASESFGGVHSSGNGGCTAAATKAGCFGETL